MNEYTEDDFLAISNLFDFVFCKRRWSLKVIERQEGENALTAEGVELHQKVHDGYSYEKRGNIIISRGIPVFSRSLGLRGICDVVEFKYDEKNGAPLYGRPGVYMPAAVEFKKGRQIENDADRLQAAAQTMCLEEMLSIEIPIAYVYHIETKKREEVNVDPNLRRRIEKMSSEMHEYIKRGYAPKVKRQKYCANCALKEICMPKLFRTVPASEYIAEKISQP